MKWHRCELDWLRENYANDGARSIALLLRRTKREVEAKARELGLVEHTHTHTHTHTHSKPRADAEPRPAPTADGSMEPAQPSCLSGNDCCGVTDQQGDEPSSAARPRSKKPKRTWTPFKVAGRGPIDWKRPLFVPRELGRRATQRSAEANPKLTPEQQAEHEARIVAHQVRVADDEGSLPIVDC